jgi:hypothetical protein
MTERSRCPHCGAPGRVAAAPGYGSAPAHGAGAGPLELLYQEIHRIREIAEARAAPGGGEPPAPAVSAPAGSAGSERRVAELTREVQELRATVARLRGTTARSLARSA